MRFVADECVDAELVRALRAAGHEVAYILETSKGADDLTVLRIATEERRILITEDKDFGELAFRQSAVAGVMLLRIEPEHRHRKWDRLRIAVERFGDDLQERYTVVELNRVRSRLLKPT
jgi:predicted nuclease of predicted toxin-antitoxin system